MARSISYLQPGAKIKDSIGNTYVVLAHNHYAEGQVTVWTEKLVTTMKYSSIVQGYLDYEYTDINAYLKNTYPNTLSHTIKYYTVTTKLPYTDIISSALVENRYIESKYFLLSSTELGSTDYSYENNHKTIPYLGTYVNRKSSETYWTRTECSTHNNVTNTTANSYGTIMSSGGLGYPTSVNAIFGVRPAFNLSHELMVEDEVENGYYKIVEVIPPKISNISNMVGNFGSDTTINYEVVNEEGHELTHYFSIDNGDSWQVIKPTKNGDSYSFKHVFNEVKAHYCRIKVIDAINSSATSNLFTVTVNHSVPNINILGHTNLDFRFRVNCITSELSRIEIYVNDVLKETITENLDFTQTYSIDKSLLTNSKNYVQVKATAKSGLVGTKDIEVRKSTYDIPAIGSKVVINSDVYTVESAKKSGNNIVLNLVEALVEKVSKGDLIYILQDNVKVKCSLSNIESKLEYKDMKLVKVKALKGDLAGFIEEKYILDGEGRYSAIKLELEKFNSSIDVGVKELQQMFDYLED